MEHDLSHLEDQLETGLRCDFNRAIWDKPDEPYPDPPQEGCTERTEWVFELRLCPCWINLRECQDEVIAGQVHVFAGLGVTTTPLCRQHVEYFTDFVNFPFVCPGCGVAFMTSGEIFQGAKRIDTAS